MRLNFHVVSGSHDWFISGSHAPAWNPFLTRQRPVFAQRRWRVEKATREKEFISFYVCIALSNKH
jgi:hypothetical protein